MTTQNSPDHETTLTMSAEHRMSPATVADVQAGELRATHADPDDTWDISALPGERAALDALQWNWGQAYEIGVDDGEWWCRRRDGKGGRETASAPDNLHTMIVTDYGFFPVPREYHSTTQDTTQPTSSTAET